MACPPAGIYESESCTSYTVWCITPSFPHAGQALSGLPAAAALLRTQHGQHQRSKLWSPMQQAWQHASAHLERDEEQQPTPVPKAAAAGDAVALRGTTASPVTISGVLSPADTYGKVCRGQKSMCSCGLPCSGSMCIEPCLCRAGLDMCNGLPCSDSMCGAPLPVQGRACVCNLLFWAAMHRRHMSCALPVKGRADMGYLLFWAGMLRRHVHPPWYLPLLIMLGGWAWPISLVSAFPCCIVCDRHAHGHRLLPSSCCRKHPVLPMQCCNAALMQVAGSLSSLPSLHCIAGSRGMAAHLRALQRCTFDKASNNQQHGSIGTPSMQCCRMLQQVPASACAFESAEAGTAGALLVAPVSGKCKAMLKTPEIQAPCALHCRLVRWAPRKSMHSSCYSMH